MFDHTYIIKFLESEHVPFERNVDLKAKTWIKRGGNASIWVQPDRMSNFIQLISFCQKNEIYCEVIGNTSNCYFLNDYNPDLVISTLNLNKIAINKDTIKCNCGYNVSKLARTCNSMGIAGFEGFIGLPGTVGAAAINNSGCFGCEMSKVINSVTIIKNCEIINLSNNEMCYQFRNSVLKSKEIIGIVIAVTFNINHMEDPLKLKKKAIEFQHHRKTLQEQKYPNLGSTFSIIKFKNLSFHLRIINYFALRLLNLLIKNPITKQKINTLLCLKLRKAGEISKYVSKYGIGCFIWKDSNADQLFSKYIHFIQKNSTNSVIEIDIKSSK